MAQSDLRAVVRAVPKKTWNRMEIFLQSLAINLLALALPIFILQVYDRILPLGSTNSLTVLATGFAIVIAFDTVLKLARTRIITWNGAQFEHAARLTALDKILHCSLEQYEQESPGAYLEKVNAISSVKEFYSTQIATLFIDLPFAVLFLGLIYLLGGPLVYIPLALLCIFGIIAIIVGFNLRSSIQERVDHDDKRYDFLIEVLNGMTTIKAMNLKLIMQRRFERLQELTALAVRKVAHNSAVAQGVGALFSQINMVGVVGFGAYLVLNGGLTAGTLAACMLLSGRALQPLQSAMGIWTSYQTVKVSAGKVRDVMNLVDEAPRNLPAIPPLTGKLEVRGLNFAYGGGDPFIKNINLELNPGEIISIEGANSSGRTTLLLLLLGMLKPQSGEILLDGQNIFDFNLQSVRQEISAISHNAPLYSGNLIENMTGFQCGDAIPLALELSAKLGLEKEIKALPEGYDTQVGGSAADRIPGGVRQRIAIIRALVDNPKLILFDEGNLALDSRSDGLLRELLMERKGDSSMIIVSHQEAMLAMGDKRYIMVDGELRPRLDNGETAA